MESSKHFSRNIKKIIVLLVLVVSALGIYGWSSELVTSKKQNSGKEKPAIKELTIPVAGADLYCKVIGEGRPILFIHGGPGLVHNYFLFNQQEYKKPKVYSLLIHGAEDPIPLWTTEQWANILDARRAIMSKSNHFPFVEKTEEVTRIVNEFLSVKKGKN